MTFLLLKHSGGGSFFDYHGGSLFDCQKHSMLRLPILQTRRVNNADVTTIIFAIRAAQVYGVRRHRKDKFGNQIAEIRRRFGSIGQGGC
jgi:hypothetical protein